MKLSKVAVVALVFLATCSEEAREPGPANIESAQKSLGKSPSFEVATWQRVGASSTPEGRYLQAAAFDDARKVVVMFGGMSFDPNNWMGTTNKETWEWSPATGKWTNRTGTGAAPDARSGAAMVYDSKRSKLVLFGGRAVSGYNYEDTWEWDPGTGAWTNISASGNHPSGRSQHGMVYDKSSGNIYMFGGGRSDLNYPDGTGVTYSFGDAWQFDPTTRVWTSLSVTAGPSARHDMGMTWDSNRNKAVVFGGMQSDIAGASGVPKQDTWEWEPSTNTWTERTTAGNKPSQRYAHSMAFDSTRGRMMLFGGWDIATGGYLNDLWEWDPTSGGWSARTSGSATNWPSGRLYASMVYVEGSARIELVAGAVVYNPYGSYGTGGIWIGPMPVGYYGINGSKEVWELDPSSAVFTDRSAPLDVPTPRSNHAMAYFPPTAKTYMFGGWDNMKGQAYDDLWEWNGASWAQVAATKRPPARGDAGLAYDPARKSLILFGGSNIYGSGLYNDTWEWTSTGGWTQLKTSGSPDPLYGHGMVTDTVHNRILLFGGYSDKTYYYGPDGGIGPGVWRDPMRNEVWEWNGEKASWTNRSPTSAGQTPAGRQYPTLAFDEGRQKLFLLDGAAYNWNTGASTSAFWEWDPDTTGWAQRDPGDWMQSSYYTYAVYDPIRRREVILTDTSTYTGGTNETWELDARGPTWYVRTISNAPPPRYYTAMAFDSARGVAVLFGGTNSNTGSWSNDTWEYKVTNWGNGTGCTSSFATSCASGSCVEGVCCETSSCTGPCNSCNVAGAEGTCLPAKAGTEVPGSCEKGQACDGNGKCLSSNGQACTSAGTCASGYCADGVCCNSACTGACVSCAQSGKGGKCSPYTAGSDPQNECGKGTGLCRSTCDGVGACVFPGTSQPCATCNVCDGAGTCNVYDPYCTFAGGGGRGGTGGYYTTVRGGSGGYTTSFGGSGGFTTARGGSGGSGGSGGVYTTVRGGSGGSGGSGGVYTTVRGGSGGSGGYSTARGGSGGFSTSFGGSGGYTTARGGSGGFLTSVGGSGGKADAGTTKDGSYPALVDGAEGITSARLHRSGCYCELGNARESSNVSLGVPLFALGTFFWLRARRRRR